MLQVSERPAPPSAAELAALTELRAELARIRAVHGEGATIDEERVRAALAAPVTSPPVERGVLVGRGSRRSRGGAGRRRTPATRPPLIHRR